MRLKSKIELGYAKTTKAKFEEYQRLKKEKLEEEERLRKEEEERKEQEALNKSHKVNKSVSFYDERSGKKYSVNESRMSRLNESVISKKLSPEEEEREQRRQMMDDIIDESRVDFEESMILDAEFRDKYPMGSLVQGLNLFGKCTAPGCGKKFVVKLGYGKFEIGKKSVNFTDNRKLVTAKPKAKSELSKVIDHEFDKIEEMFGAGSELAGSQVSMIQI